MPIQLGRRYVDEQTGIQVLCTKAGEGSLYVDDREMEVQQPRAAFLGLDPAHSPGVGISRRGKGALQEGLLAVSDTPPPPLASWRLREDKALPATSAGITSKTVPCISRFSPST